MNTIFKMLKSAYGFGKMVFMVGATAQHESGFTMGHFWFWLQVPTVLEKQFLWVVQQRNMNQDLHWVIFGFD